MLTGKKLLNHRLKNLPIIFVQRRTTFSEKETWILGYYKKEMIPYIKREVKKALPNNIVHFRQRGRGHRTNFHEEQSIPLEKALYVSLYADIYPESGRPYSATTECFINNP